MYRPPSFYLPFITSWFGEFESVTKNSKRYKIFEQLKKVIFLCESFSFVVIVLETMMWQFLSVVVKFVWLKVVVNSRCYQKQVWCFVSKTITMSDCLNDVFVHACSKVQKFCFAYKIIACESLVFVLRWCECRFLSADF